MRLSRIAALGLLPLSCLTLLGAAISQGAAQPRPKAAVADSSGTIACNEFHGQSVRPAQYTLALDLTREPVFTGLPRALQAAIVVFVKDDTQKIFPIVQVAGQYFAMCDNADPARLSELLAQMSTNAKISPQKPAAERELIDKLQAAKAQAPEGLRAWGVAEFRRDTSGTNFIEWPSQYRRQIPSRGVLKNLIEVYVSKAPRTLLADTKIALLEYGLVWPPKREATATSAPPATNPVASPTPPSGASPSQTQTDSSHSPRPQELPRVLDQQPVQFTIGFRDSDLWRNIKLNEAQRISTFGYCEDSLVERTAEGSYILQCKPGLRDGKIAIRIQGFQLLDLSQNEASQIDTKLQVMSFRTPYPKEWGRSTADFAEVGGGRLAEVLRTRIPLDQSVAGVAACTDTAAVTVGAIVNQALDFPPPPCRRYELEFAPGLTDNSARVTGPCMAGAQDPQPIRNGRVTCWRSQRQNGSIELVLEVRTGFLPIPFPIPREWLERQTIPIVFDTLAAALIPIWPYAGSSPFNSASERGEAPHYAAGTIEYIDSTNKPCPKPAPIQRPGTMPSLKETRCEAIPAKARIALAQDRAKPSIPPSKAFLPSYTDEYAITPVLRTEDISKLKVPLPIRFTAAKASDYKELFKLSNRQPAQGAYVFNGTRCEPKREGKLFEFAGNPASPVTWPQAAAIYDDRNGEPSMLTLCAPGVVEDGSDGPYMTFELEGKLAAGPRRVVIVANNQTLVRNGASSVFRDALRKLVDTADAEHKSRAPLSPISVYSMDDRENLRPLFTGEEAVSNPTTAKSKLNDLDTVAPKIPDLLFLINQPQLKDMDRLILIMDGSGVSDNNNGHLFQIARRLNAIEGGKVSFYITGNCKDWPSTEVRGFECFPLQGEAGKAQLTQAFKELVNRREDRVDGIRGTQSAQPDGSPRIDGRVRQ
jgi:hypothetical protein